MTEDAYSSSPRSQPRSQPGRWDGHGDVSDGDWQGKQEVYVPHQPRELLGPGGPRRCPEYCHWYVSEWSHITDDNIIILYKSAPIVISYIVERMRCISKVSQRKPMQTLNLNLDKFVTCIRCQTTARSDQLHHCKHLCSSPFSNSFNNKPTSSVKSIMYIQIQYFWEHWRSYFLSFDVQPQFSQHHVFIGVAWPQGGNKSQQWKIHLH